MALAKAESEQQLAELAERSRIERQIAAELTTAQSFLDTSSHEVPDSASLQRGLDTIQRGLGLLEENNVKGPVAQDLRSTHRRILELPANAELVAELEHIWELELSQQAEAKLAAAGGVEVDWRL